VATKHPSIAITSRQTVRALVVVTILSVSICLLLLTQSPLSSAAPGGTISLTTIGSPVTENFDTLATSGPAASTTLPTSWDLAESGTNANTTYSAGTGSGNAGDTYSFGAAGNSERAFGCLQSGSLVPTIGASFTNNTGSTLLSVDV
jgi:hypothetical protein